MYVLTCIFIEKNDYPILHVSCGRLQCATLQWDEISAGASSPRTSVGRPSTPTTVELSFLGGGIIALKKSFQSS